MQVDEQCERLVRVLSGKDVPCLSPPERWLATSGPAVHVLCAERVGVLLRLHLESPVVQRTGCHVLQAQLRALRPLSNVASTNDAHHFSALSRSVFTAVIAALQTHPADASVQLHGSRALLEAAEKCTVDAQQAAAACALLTAALGQFPASPEIVAAALNTLAALRYRAPGCLGGAGGLTSLAAAAVAALDAAPLPACRALAGVLLPRAYTLFKPSADGTPFNEFVSAQAAVAAAAAALSGAPGATAVTRWAWRGSRPSSCLVKPAAIR